MTTREEIASEDQVVSITGKEFLSFMALADENAKMKSELEILKNDLTKLKLSASVGKSGNVAEAVQLGLYMSEFNDFMSFLGKDKVDFSNEEIIDVRAFIIATLEALRDELKLEEWFSANEDVLIIIKNLRQAILARQAVETEATVPLRQVVKN